MRCNRPALALARSEVALRQDGSRKRRHSLRLLRRRLPTSFRALSVAGRAAPRLRESEALDFYRRAEATAPSQVARRDALWDNSPLTLSRPRLRLALSPHFASLRSNAREILQSSAYGVVYRNRFGRSLDLTDVDAAYALVPTIHDPLVVSSFQSVYSFALVLSAGTRCTQGKSRAALHRSRIIAWTLQFHTL